MNRLYRIPTTLFLLVALEGTPSEGYYTQGGYYGGSGSLPQYRRTFNCPPFFPLVGFGRTEWHGYRDALGIYTCEAACMATLFSPSVAQCLPFWPPCETCNRRCFQTADQDQRNHCFDECELAACRPYKECREYYCGLQCYGRPCVGPGCFGGGAIGGAGFIGGGGFPMDTQALPWPAQGMLPGGAVQGVGDIGAAGGVGQGPAGQLPPQGGPADIGAARAAQGGAGAQQPAEFPPASQAGGPTPLPSGPPAAQTGPPADVQFPSAGQAPGVGGTDALPPLGGASGQP